MFRIESNSLTAEQMSTLGQHLDFLATSCAGTPTVFSWCLGSGSLEPVTLSLAILARLVGQYSGLNGYARSPSQPSACPAWSSRKLAHSGRMMPSRRSRHQGQLLVPIVQRLCHRNGSGWAAAIRSAGTAPCIRAKSTLPVSRFPAVPCRTAAGKLQNWTASASKLCGSPCRSTSCRLASRNRSAHCALEWNALPCCDVPLAHW